MNFHCEYEDIEKNSYKKLKCIYGKEFWFCSKFTSSLYCHIYTANSIAILKF